MTTPTDHDLNVSLARLIGYSVRGTWYYDGRKQEAPPFNRSLDALFAPGGPVEYARALRRLTVVLRSFGDKYEANVLDGWIPVIEEPAVKERPAEALATALHEAFMKEQGQ